MTLLYNDEGNIRMQDRASTPVPMDADGVAFPAQASEQSCQERPKEHVLWRLTGVLGNSVGQMSAPGKQRLLLLRTPQRLP